MANLLSHHEGFKHTKKHRHPDCCASIQYCISFILLSFVSQHKAKGKLPARVFVTIEESDMFIFLIYLNQPFFPSHCIGTVDFNYLHHTQMYLWIF